MSKPVSSLIVAGVPTNLRLPEGSRLTYVDGDMHDICARIRELDDTLSIVLMEHVNGGAAFAITERDRSGREALIFRVGEGCEIDALDQRVIDKLNYIRSVPAGERARQLDAELQREAEARRVEESETLYEKIGSSFYDNLFACGFVHTPKAMSVRPLNATAKRAGRHA